MFYKAGHLEDMQSLMQQFAQSSSPENFKLYSKSIQAGATITANQYWNTPDQFYCGIYP
jgi:hypothetical protein